MSLWRSLNRFARPRCINGLVSAVDDRGDWGKDEGAQKRAEIFCAKARELEGQSRLFHDAVLSHESLSSEKLIDLAKSPTR